MVARFYLIFVTVLWCPWNSTNTKKMPYLSTSILLAAFPSLSQPQFTRNVEEKLSRGAGMPHPENTLGAPYPLSLTWFPKVANMLGWSSLSLHPDAIRLSVSQVIVTYYSLDIGSMYTQECTSLMITIIFMDYISDRQLSHLILVIILSKPPPVYSVSAFVHNLYFLSEEIANSFNYVPFSWMIHTKMHNYPQ